MSGNSRVRFSPNVTYSVRSGSTTHRTKKSINSFYERLASTETVASKSLKNRTKNPNRILPGRRKVYPDNIDIRPPSRSSRERRLLRGKSSLNARLKSDFKLRPSSRRGSKYKRPGCSVFERLAQSETFASASAKSKVKRPSRSTWPKARGRRVSDRNAHTLKCNHYVKKCDIVARCCNRIFACRMCHDAASDHGPIGRYRVKEVVCKECNTRQKRSNECTKCGVVFAEYYCDLCNIWMDKSKQPFHCRKCKFCRLGGESNFRHCDDCNNCVSVKTYLTHECKNKKKNTCCPICIEDLDSGIDIDIHSDLYNSEQSLQSLACGHAVHSLCFKDLKTSFYTCSICGTKSLIEALSVGATTTESDSDSEESLMSIDEEEEDLFEVAVAKNTSVDFVKLLIESGAPDLFTNKDKYGNNLLHLACRFNAPVEVLQLILDNGPADMITDGNMYGDTPLHLACQYQSSVNIVHILLDRGSLDIISYQDNDGYTPLHLATQFEASVQVVQVLLDKGPSDLIMLRENDGYLPIHLACHFKGSAEVIRILLQEGPDEMVTCADNDGYLPLHLASRYDAPVEVIQLLLNKNGAQTLSAQDNEGYTALQLACEHNASVEIVKVLLDNGPSDMLISKTNNGNTALYLTCENQCSVELVKLLLDRGPPDLASSQECEGDNALHVACQFKASLGVIQLLVEKGSYDIVTAKTNDDYTPLHLAAQFNAPFDIVQLLLLNGASDTLTWQESDGYNPLHLALENHASDEVIKLLLDGGPPEIVISQTNKGWNALHHACTYKTPIELVQLIIDKGASTELFTSTTRRALLPLHHAIAVRYKDAAKLIIQIAGLKILTSTKKCDRLPSSIIKDIIEHHSPNDDEIKAAVLNNHPPALKFATDSVRANASFILEAVKKNGNVLEFTPRQFREDKEVVLAAVKTTPRSLKFALGNLSNDEECLLAADLSAADQVGKSDLPLIVISTPYSIGEDKTSYATEFVLWINQISFFHQFRVYHPNAGNRESCDPDYTTLSWPCRGTTYTCTKPRYLKIGVPRENECCWRFNFRYNLDKGKQSGGFMIQLSGWDELMDKHTLDRGQHLEMEMAHQAGVKVFRVLETQNMIETGDLQLDRRQVGQLQQVIKLWMKGDRNDLSVVEVKLPKIDTDASLLMHAVVDQSFLTFEEDLVIETLNQIN